jgi:putative ligand-binding protein with streptavidin-like fold
VTKETPIDPVGPWITTDGRMRVELRADGSFAESRTGSERTYHGTYRVEGSRIHFHDPSTGYQATGEFRDGTMYADGCEFRRVVTAS